MQEEIYDLRKYLRELIEYPGATIQELADSVGYTRTQVSRIVNGKVPGSAKFWGKINELRIQKHKSPEKTTTITSQLTPKARAALKVIQELEGGSEIEALNRTLEEHGLHLLQGSFPRQQSVQRPKEEPDRQEDDN